MRISRQSKSKAVKLLSTLLVRIYVLFHVLSRHFLFYFEKITNFPLSFQVTCPSSRVKCLIVFPDSQSVSTCSPWSLVCSNSLRLPVYRVHMLSPCRELHYQPLDPLNHSHRILGPAASDSPAEPFLCNLF